VQHPALKLLGVKSLYGNSTATYDLRTGVQADASTLFTLPGIQEYSSDGCHSIHSLKCGDPFHFGEQPLFQGGF